MKKFKGDMTMSKSVDITDRLRTRFGQSTPRGVKEFLAEFFGTFILVTFGNASVAQSVFSGGKNDFFGINWGYGIGVFFGILVAGGVSGGHLNPAVTLAMAIWGRLQWSKVPFYMVGQYLGAFAASIMLFVVYNTSFYVYESIPSQTTASIFATYPGLVTTSNSTMVSHLTATNGMIDQIFGTMLLLICVCAVNDTRNMKVPSWMSAFFVAMAVLNIGICFGINCGYAINPARDLSPRIFTMIAGWGNLPFTATTVDGVPWWWIPIVGPHIGAVLGLFLYTILIEMHHHTPESPLGKTVIANNDYQFDSPLTEIHASCYDCSKRGTCNCDVSLKLLGQASDHMVADQY